MRCCLEKFNQLWLCILETTHKFLDKPRIVLVFLLHDILSLICQIECRFGVFFSSLSSLYLFSVVPLLFWSQANINQVQRIHTHTHSVDRRPTAMWDYIDSIHSFFGGLHLLYDVIDYLQFASACYGWNDNDDDSQFVDTYFSKGQNPKSNVNCFAMSRSAVFLVTHITLFVVCFFLDLWWRWRWR